MVQLDLFYQSDLLKVEVNQQYHYFQATWLKQPLSEDFRKETKTFTQNVLANNFNKILYNVRARDMLL
jgi:hypothetical protein